MMKRVRVDQIHSALNQYLKRRHYSDQEVKKESKAAVAVERVVLQAAVHGEGSMSNVVAYSSITGDVTACEVQYNRLRNFIMDAVDPYRQELKQLLCPVFIHMFLELLCNGHKTPARKFYSRHCGKFQEMKEYWGTVEALQSMYTAEDVPSNKQIKDFRDHKFSASLTEDAMHYLFRYLKNGDNVIMLQLFNQHIVIKVKSVDDGENSDSQAEVNGQEIPAVSPPFTPDNKVIRNEMSLGVLQQIIKKVREGPPCAPSICFYSFLNTHQGLCNASISDDNKLMCACFEDSALRVWSLTPDKLEASQPTVNISHVNMASDFYEDVQEKLKPCSACERATLRGHSGTVYSAQFIHDTQYIISGSEDTSVRLWSMKTQTNAAVYRGHNYPVWGIATSQIGTYFASCSQDRTAKLWTTDRIYPLRTYVGHTDDVDCIAFHPNGNYLATGGSDRSVRLWSVQEGTSVRLFHGHKGVVMSLAFSPNGQLLASAGEDRRVKVWDLNAGTLLKDLRGHMDTVYSLSFSQDGSTLASGGLDCVVRVWDVRKNPASAPGSENHNSCELLGAYPTKSTVVHCLKYSKYNVLMAAGAFGC